MTILQNSPDMTKQRPRVAIVDDDAAVRKSLSLLLDAAAFETDTYASAADFLRSLPNGLPHCLIVDLQMPDMTGLELQQHLVDAGIDIPTIAITAHSEFAAEERCRSAGARAFLIKPIQDETLIAAINSIVPGIATGANT
jgi:FixJ family two-component response regulator